MKINRQFFKFLFTGGLNTLFSYFVFVILYFFIQQKELVVTLTTIIAVTFNYYSYKHIVFIDSDKQKIIAFIGVYFFIYLLSLIHLWITVDIYKVNIYLAQFIALFYMPLLGFYLNKKYVYIQKEN
ncbi:MAG: GtrA family protein [Arcobacteraceae bacterium]|nr:GtrA family protein [Arcobacteraceae bacterium]